MPSPTERILVDLAPFLPAESGPRFHKNPPVVEIPLVKGHGLESAVRRLGFKSSAHPVDTNTGTMVAERGPWRYWTIALVGEVSRAVKPAAADAAPAPAANARPLSAILSDDDADSAAAHGVHSLLVRQDGGQWELAITRLDGESAKTWAQRCALYTDALGPGDRARRYDGKRKCVEAWPTSHEETAPATADAPAAKSPRARRKAA